MSSPESEEFTRWRRDLEDQEAFKANSRPLQRQWWESPLIKEVDPRERD